MKGMRLDADARKVHSGESWIHPHFSQTRCLMCHISAYLYIVSMMIDDGEEVGEVIGTFNRNLQYALDQGLE